MSVAVSLQGTASVGPAAVQPSRGFSRPLRLLVRAVRRLGLVSLLPGLLLGSALVAAPFAGTRAVERPAPAVSTPATSTPAVSTPAVSTPAIHAPATRPAVTTTPTAVGAGPMLDLAADARTPGR